MKGNRFFCQHCRQKRKLVPSKKTPYLYVCKSCRRVPGSRPYVFKLCERPSQKPGP